ncbi:MAG: aspartate ammonia-lyase [Actinomycetota bacterium]
MRVEKDALGEVEVPDDAYYGAETARAVRNFHISRQRQHPLLIRAIAQIKLAAARANVAVGALSDEIGEVIERAAQEIVEGGFADQFVVDAYSAGAGTSIHMNVNEVIANRAGELLSEPKGTYERVHPNDHVNMGQSSNDVFPTALRIAILTNLASGLLVGLDKLIEALKARGEAFQGIVKSGRTHLQDAVPITLGREFAAYANMVLRAADPTSTAEKRLQRIPLGGTAVGTGFGTAPGYRERVVRELREITELDLESAEDLVEAVRNLGDFAEFAGALKTLSLALGQIANDLRMLSMGPRTGLAEISLPAVQPGSSMMPGKINPSVAEVMNMVCMRVSGAEHTVALAAGAGQLDMNVMTPVIADELLKVLGMLHRAVGGFTEMCVKGIEADVDRCREFAEASLGIATALDPVIGYEKAAELVVKAFRTGRTLKDVVRESGLVGDEQLDDILNPERYV